jgi:hypothetical protein
METAASQDLSAVSVMPELTPLLGTLPAGPQAMMTHLNAWVAAGSHRQKNAVGDVEYADVASVAAMDELYPRVVEALFDGVMKQNGNTDRSNFGIPSGYNTFPMGFAGLPNSHGGSSYGSGWEGNAVKALRQARGLAVGLPFSSSITSRLCGTGTANCQTALDNAVVNAYNAMVSANGGSTNVAAWTKNTALGPAPGANTTMRNFDAIQFTAAGVIGQPTFDWQNRPTFQQVVVFQSHATSGGGIPEFPVGPVVPIAGALAAIGVWVAARRRTSRPVPDAPESLSREEEL